MKRPDLRARGGASFNITPMIDVVMLLIVFFLLAGHLSRQESLVPLELPEASTGREDVESDLRRLVVHVLPDGKLLLAGQPVEPDEFARRIKAEGEAAQGAVEVRIRADRAVEFRRVEPLLVACAKGGIWRVSFAVTGHQN